jgi:hypothetical protein
MGAAIDAVGDVPTPLRNSPVVLVGAVLTGLLVVVGLVVSLISLVGQLLHDFVIVPLSLVALAVGFDTEAVAGGQLAAASPVFGLLAVVGLLLPLVVSVTCHVAYYRRRREPTATASATGEVAGPDTPHRDPQRTVDADDTGFDFE